MNMMLQKDREFMLPARPAFIAASFLVALIFNGLPWSGMWLALRPDMVALVLLYWCTHKPYRIGIGFAWIIGILADVADASLFGQHALAYTLLAFGGIVLHRRVQMFNLRQQTFQVFLLLLAAYAAYAGVHWVIQGRFAWGYMLGSVTSALCWAPMTLLLQALRHPRGGSERQ
ncbi:MAG TPA: rod shape-determining protein MreD [Gallionellaceae bacterium]|nr:rod shape-determining protein MreD [Gallionellaceae bacterium]